MDLIIAKKIYLILLLIVPLYIILHLFFANYSKRKSIHFANFKIMKKLSRKYSLTFHTSLLIIRIFVIIFLVLLLAGTKISSNGVGRNVNYIFIVDNSMSMQSFVSDNVTRIDFTRDSIGEFITEMQLGTKLGIMTFSSFTKVLVPLTQDKIYLKNTLNRISISKMSGTNLADSIFTATGLLFNTEGVRKIVLISDGRDTSFGDVKDAVEYAKDNGVIISTIGFSEQKESGEISTSFVNKDILNLIPKWTEGKYYEASEQNTVTDIFKEIMGKKENKVVLDLTEPLALLVLLLLLFEFIFVKTIYKITP